MYFVENPVLQREMLVNLRMKRAFVLLLVYQLLLAAVVYFAWPHERRLRANAQEAKELVDMFFLGQYILASLMAPSFAAAAITGEKERQTYEMLLASPLKPAAITIGKLFASLAHIAMLIVGSLPIVMLCLPLGGVSLYEVLAAYFGLILSVISFGMISIACSSYFQRTSASLVASYLLILPLAILAVVAWRSMSTQAELRLVMTLVILPVFAAALCVSLFFNTNARLLHPPDVGSQGKDVVDLEREAEEVVGLVIQRDQFPDRLFAPPKRDDLMEDGANPVYDKEIHSEIFSQGTLMLRLVIQVSMVLAIPIMAVCLFFLSSLAPWYIAYVIVFNMLVGPVFSAGSVTGERERQTLDLLLTTDVTPWQILWGKLVAGLRISSVLTLFLVWPLFLAFVMVPDYWSNIGAVTAYLVIILAVCATTANLAMFCSVVFRKTSMSLMTSYLLIAVLFCVPLAVTFFGKTFLAGRYLTDRNQATGAQDPAAGRVERAAASASPTGGPSSAGLSLPAARPIDQWIHQLAFTSPFAAAFAAPFTPVDDYRSEPSDSVQLFPDSWTFVFGHLLWTGVLNALLLGLMVWLFHVRWRVSQ